MNDAEFELRMREVDALLIERDVRVPQRFALAWFDITNERRCDVLPRDPNLGPYEGPNLFRSIVDWYVARYPTQATIGYEWGPRLLVVRGEIFLAEIPTHFNPSSYLNALDYLQGLSPVLLEGLTRDERDSIQRTYNRYFWQASDLAINWTDWCTQRRHGLSSDLIDRSCP